MARDTVSNREKGKENEQKRRYLRDHGHRPSYEDSLPLGQILKFSPAKQTNNKFKGYYNLISVTNDYATHVEMTTDKQLIKTCLAPELILHNCTLLNNFFDNFSNFPDKCKEFITLSPSSNGNYTALQEQAKVSLHHARVYHDEIEGLQYQLAHILKEDYNLLKENYKYFVHDKNKATEAAKCLTELKANLEKVKDLEFIEPLFKTITLFEEKRIKLSNGESLVSPQ